MTTTPTTASCPICGGPLPPPARSGRPKTYCGPGCRASADVEARRLERQLDGLATRISTHRELLAGFRANYCGCHDRAEHMAFLEDEATRIDLRLRQVRGAGYVEEES